MERLHVLQLLIWGASSFLLGAGVIVALRVQRARAPLAVWFAGTMAVWGVAECGFALVRLRGLTERDFASALRLTAQVRLATIGDAWLVAVAAVVIWVGVALVKRLDLTGIGMALVAHGGVLFVLDRLFLARLATGA